MPNDEKYSLEDKFKKMKSDMNDKFEENKRKEEEFHPDFMSNTKKRLFFDDEGNEVPEEIATRMVVQVFDQNGTMIHEKWAVKNPDPDFEDDIHYEEIYYDKDGNITQKENAVIVGFKKYISNNFVSEEKYKIDELLEQMKL